MVPSRGERLVHARSGAGQARSALVRQRRGYHFKTEQHRGKQDAFVKFMDTPEGPCRTVDYDRTICGALSGAFGSRTTLSIEKYKSVQISVDGSTKIPDDGISFVGANNKVSFTKLQLDSAVQQAAKATVDETVAALAKNGWKP